MEESFDNASELQCAHCGRSFYYELLECPHCGERVYPEEKVDSWEVGQGGDYFFHLKEVLRIPLAVLLGWFLAAFIGLGLYLIAENALGVQATDTQVLIISAVTVSLGTFVGVFVAVMVARRSSRAVGTLVVLLGILLSLLISYREMGADFVPVQWVGRLLVWGAIIAAGIAAILIGERQLRRDLYESLFAPALKEDELYHELVVKAGYDTSTADRMIEYERKRAPKAARASLIQNAIWRWERDNR